jgi:hypothetical protein
MPDAPPQSRYARPTAQVVHRNTAILGQAMAEQDPAENIEYIVAVICERKGMNNGVEVHH